MDDDDPADAVASPGARGGTLTDEADPPPPEHATAPHATTNAKAPHPARHHRPRRRPDEPDDGSPHDTDEPGDPPHDTDEPGDPPHDTDEPDDTDISAPDGRRTGNHDTEELLPQGP